METIYYNYVSNIKIGYVVNIEISEDVLPQEDRTCATVGKTNDVSEVGKMVLVLLGKPGAGKGTHGGPLAEKYGIPVISTGDLIRKILKKDNNSNNNNDDPEVVALRNVVEPFVTAGKLVPDEIVLKLLLKRIAEPDCEKGYILDGFPRNLAQAKALDAAGIRVSSAINIGVSDDVICKRLTGRRSCSKCNKVYNLNTDRKPKVDGVCDSCGSPLFQRDDDNEKTIRNRLQTYVTETAPLIDYYNNKGVLCSVNGEGKQNEILNEILAKVKLDDK